MGQNSPFLPASIRQMLPGFNGSRIQNVFVMFFPPNPVDVDGPTTGVDS
jgi:hypothetical protein